MCAIKIVRDVGMESSKECSTDTLTDVMCVNGLLSSALPYKCGAWQEMRREIAVPTMAVVRSVFA